ncbi:MAG: hypothetical protein LC769_02775 [Chloroflexi bacterium]|nr:hypothetical protein [Chloroflexota bacterium]
MAILRCPDRLPLGATNGLWRLRKCCPKASIVSADEASIRLNGLRAKITRQHTNETLQLVQKIGGHYYPDVELDIKRLSWDELTAEPYLDDVDLLRSRQLGEAAVKLVNSLEEMVDKRGGEVSSVAAYLGLHNTAYAVYVDKPTIKVAGASEGRFTLIQRALTSVHPELPGTKDWGDRSCLVSGVIRDTPSTAPYYVHTGVTVPSVLESLDGMDYPLDILAKEYNLGRVASRVAALDTGLQRDLV